jgi:hypothetical protein
MVHPDSDDVIVRQKPGNPSITYLLGTSATPDQFLLRTHDEAVSQALAFAKRQHVRADGWGTSTSAVRQRPLDCSASRRFPLNISA